MSDPLNPYAPPQVQPSAAPPETFISPPARPAEYRSTQATARMVILLTFIAIALHLLLGGSCYRQIQLLQSAQTGGLHPATVEIHDARHQAIARMVIAGALINFVGLLVWIYAAHRNLPALGAENLDFSPGWAVGWFFIPIMNLYKPCQAMFELWRESDPARLPPVSMRGPPPAATIVGWWWFLRIVAVITGPLAGVAMRRVSTIDELITATWFIIAGLLLVDIPMNLCQISIVRGVQTAQEERHGLIIAAGGLEATSVTRRNRWGDTA